MTRLFLLAVAMSGIVELRDGWQYALTPPRATPPGAEVTWGEEAAPRADRDLWFRYPLPAPLPDEPRLAFRAYAPRFELFVERQRVYAFDEPESKHRLRLHVVTLPRDAAGKHLYVHMPPGGRLPLLGGTPLVASAAATPHALMRAATQPLHGDLEDVIVGAFLLVIGIAAVVVSRMRRRTNASALLWFGVFTFLYGARLLAESYLLLLAGVSTLQMEYAGVWITYVISLPGWLMASKLIGGGWKSTLRWQVWVFAIFAPIGIAVDLVRREPGSLELVNNTLVVIGGVNILGNLLYLRAQRWRELWVVMAGGMVFMLFALANNLASLGVLPIDDADETPGFVVFVAALGYAALRMFLRGERERVALEGELATAREIQRSILPTSMPEVAGFRFAARYDPASSVAGDLYDFLVADDQHVGVLVADVSGHGVPAALIASMVKVAVTSQARLASDPAALLREVNATLRRDVRRNFVTATVLWLDAAQRRVTVCNAGHAPPLLFRGDEVVELGRHGVLLGRFARVEYTSDSVDLLPGDRIVAWTDGIVEARNARGDQFGDARLRELVRAGNSVDEVIAAVHRWRAAGDDHDDLTLVAIEVL